MSASWHRHSYNVHIRDTELIPATNSPHPAEQAIVDLQPGSVIACGEKRDRLVQPATIDELHYLNQCATPPCALKRQRCALLNPVPRDTADSSTVHLWGRTWAQADGPHGLCVLSLPVPATIIKQLAEISLPATTNSRGSGFFVFPVEREATDATQQFTAGMGNPVPGRECPQTPWARFALQFVMVYAIIVTVGRQDQMALTGAVLIMVGSSTNTPPSTAAMGSGTTEHDLPA